MPSAIFMFSFYLDSMGRSTVEALLEGTLGRPAFQGCPSIPWVPGSQQLQPCFKGDPEQPRTPPVCAQSSRTTKLAPAQHTPGPPQQFMLQFQPSCQSSPCMLHPDTPSLHRLQLQPFHQNSLGTAHLSTSEPASITALVILPRRLWNIFQTPVA